MVGAVVVRTGPTSSRKRTIINPSSDAIGGRLISFRRYRAPSARRHRVTERVLSLTERTPVSVTRKRFPISKINRTRGSGHLYGALESGARAEIVADVSVIKFSLSRPRNRARYSGAYHGQILYPRPEPAARQSIIKKKKQAPTVGLVVITIKAGP